MSPFARIGFVVLALVGAAGCAPVEADVPEGADADGEEVLRRTRDTANWSYQGPMPTLDSPRVVVSLAGHTVRVTGLLPTSFTGTLPYHAITEPDPAGTGRTQVTLVYPIATGNPNSTTESGLTVRNPEPNDYRVCRGTLSAPTTDRAAFGGFPFIEYVCGHRDRDGRLRSGIAFHGPISSRTIEGGVYWDLYRGPVSHACNRMLGEHVLEFAKVIGFTGGRTGTPVTVIAGYDTWHGAPVDVDYPVYNNSFRRPPASQSVIFPAWQAVRRLANGALRVEFPRWACETTRCPSMPENRLDPVTGGRTPAPLACPTGASLTAVGTAGGSACASSTQYVGPITAAMRAACEAEGTSRTTCAGERLPLAQGLRLRGTGVCPAGARFDALTSYCLEGNDALGPFPSAVQSQCTALGHSATVCRAPRMHRDVLMAALRRG